MREYKVSYMLGDMYHSYIIEAENEATAIMRVINRLPDSSKKIFHEFTIDRYYIKW